MKNLPHRSPAARGFTLIELLVVISIIAILAALLLPAGAKIKQNATKSRVRTELLKLDLAINAYKIKLGHFPPDNPGNDATNQLYYELVGCERVGADFRPLDNAPLVTVADLGVAGIVNVSSGVSSDDSSVAQSFLKDVIPAQYGEDSGVRRLGVAVEGPIMFGTTKPINPFRYNSSNPINNGNSFDLWVDVKIGGKTNRISNWSMKPTVL